MPLIRVLSQAVHLRIASPEVCQKRTKQVIPLRYGGRDEDRGHKRHISPHPVGRINELQSVESRIKEGISTGQQGEQARRRLEDVGRPVHGTPEQPCRAVCWEECRAPASQIYVFCPGRHCDTLTWLRLQLERGDPAQMGHVINAQHGAN